MRNMAGYGSRGHHRGHPYEQALGKAAVPSRPNPLVGSITYASAFHRLPGPNMHAPAILDNQTNVAGRLNSALPTGLRGAGFVAEASRLSTNVDLSLGIGQPGGKDHVALSQPQAPDGPHEQNSMVQLGGHQKTVNMLLQSQGEPQEAKALLHRNLGTTKERRQVQLRLSNLNVEISKVNIKEQQQEILQQDLNEISYEEETTPLISNNSETTARLSQEREGSSNVADHGRGDAAWQEDMNLLVKEHEKVVSQMKKAHQESEALLIEKHDKIVTEMRNSFKEKKDELHESQMRGEIAVDEYEKEKQTCVRYYNELTATKRVKVVALKTLAEFVLTMKAQQVALKSSQFIIQKKRLEEAQGAMQAEGRLLQVHIVAMEATGAAMSEAIQQILALQEDQKVQLEAAVDKLTDYNAESELADQQTSELLLGLAVTVLNKLPEVDTKASSKGVNSTPTRPEALFSARHKNNVMTRTDSGIAALAKGQTAQDDLVKIKSSGPGHLVDTTMEPSSKSITQEPSSSKTITQEPSSKTITQDHSKIITQEPSKNITQELPRDFPHDTVNVECNSNDLENGGMEEQPQKKRKRELVNLTGNPETGRPSSSLSPSQRMRLPRKCARPARHVVGDQEVGRIFFTGEGTLGC